MPYDFSKASREGRYFSINAAAAGIILPIYSNTAMNFGLWNPANSGVYCYFHKITLCYVDTTGAAGGLVIGLLRNTGSSLATAAPISAFTDSTIEHGLMGPTGGGGVRATASAATVTTGLMVVGLSLGINQLVLTAADATTVPWKMDYTFDGQGLAPGHAAFLCGNIATLTKWIPSWSWAEEKA